MQLTGRNRRQVGVNRECVSAAQKLEKGGAARPDGFERERKSPSETERQGD